jgi:hypothetical protein
MEIPRICVCTAPDAAVAQTSLLIVVIAGATAVGGGDFTFVVLFEDVSEYDLLVESVTIGSTACAALIRPNMAIVIKTFFICFCPKVKVKLIIIYKKCKNVMIF